MIQKNNLLNRFSILLLCSVILSCSVNNSKKYNQEQVKDSIAEKVGTIVNQKWSTYKYKSHFKREPWGDTTVAMYSRLVKNEKGDNYIFTIDIYVRNDSIIYQGYNFPFVYDEFIKFDKLLLDCKPTDVIGDFTPEDEYMHRIYFFDNFYIRINKGGNYSIFFYSKNF